MNKLERKHLEHKHTRDKMLWVGFHTSSGTGTMKKTQAVSYRMKKPEVPSTHSRPIRCVDTGEVFPSQIAAALAHGTRPSNLSDHLKGKSITVGGRTYEYVQNATGIDKPKRNTSKRRVRCVDTGEEFESMTKAATAHNISTNGLSLHLRGVQSNVGGKRYEYV